MSPRTTSGSLRERVLTYARDTIRQTPPTPVAEVTALVAGRPRNLLLKLDGRSRWGSLKGRTALGLLTSVADELADGSEVVESTSGNLGVALAGICRELGIPFTAVVDGRLPPAMARAIRQYGGHLVEAKPGDDRLRLQRRIAAVQEILAANPRAVWTNQYENPANAAVHHLWTGPELEQQLGPEPRVLFAPVSTGGSFAGLSSHMAEKRPEIDCVAVDVAGSTIFGGPPGCRLLTGIGASKPSNFLGATRPPHIVVTDTDAIATCRTLELDAGIGVGGSSGATIAGCLRYLARHPDVTGAVCLCPDLASNYRETLYNDAWLLQADAVDSLLRPELDGASVRFDSVTRSEVSR
ncbi:pyridoxal-phosphate dependent enzyme [Amycolatopsis sp. NPDC054798]